jgi:hypothetical protein
MPMVTVSALAGAANARDKTGKDTIDRDTTEREANDIAIECAQTWRTILTLIRLDVLRLP